MTTFSYSFILILVATVLVRQWLLRRQITHVNAHRQLVPQAFEATINLEAHQKAADYTTAKAELAMREHIAIVEDAWQHLAQEGEDQPLAALSAR